jgi:hypothetical protein
MIRARLLAVAVAASLPAGCGGAADSPKPPRRIHLAMEVGAAKIVHVGDLATPGGTVSRRVKWVTIDSDEYPYDGFRHEASVRVDRASGGFDFKDHPRRNTRYRANAEGQTSRTVTVYVLPRPDLAVDRTGPRTVRLTLTERIPAHARLIGSPRVFFYLRRAQDPQYRRVAGARLGMSGRGVATASAIATVPPSKGAQFFSCAIGRVEGMGSSRTRLPQCGGPALPFPLPTANLG